MQIVCTTRDRLFWGILIVSMVGFIINSYTNIKKFFDIPVSTDINYNKESEGELPQIMICNAIPVVHSNFMAPNESKVLENEFMREAKEVFKVIPLSKKADTSADDFVRLILLRGTLKNSKLMTRRYGIHIDEVLLSCTYNGEKCKRQDFQEFTHDNYLNCFKYVPSKIHKGIETRIDMVLLTPSPEAEAGVKYPPGSWRFDKYPEMDYKSGVRLFVYPKDTFPHDKYKIYLGSGTENFIKLTKTTISKLNLKRDPCQDDELTYVDAEGQPVMTVNPGVDDCMYDELMYNTYKHCGCQPTKLMSQRRRYTDNGKKKIPFCFDIHDPANANKTKLDYERSLQCYLRSLRKKMDFMKEAYCNDPCTTVRYKKEMYSSPWPNRDAIHNTIQKYIVPKMRHIRKWGFNNTYIDELYEDEQMMENFRKKAIGKRPADPLEIVKFVQIQSTFYSNVNDNILRFKIVIEPFETEISENKAYAWEELLSDMAGIIGMYLGLSSFSLLELWDMWDAYRGKKKEERKEEKEAEKDGEEAEAMI